MLTASHRCMGARCLGRDLKPLIKTSEAGVHLLQALSVPSFPDRAWHPQLQHGLWFPALHSPLVLPFPLQPLPWPSWVAPEGSMGTWQARDPWLSLLTNVFTLDVDECAAADPCLGGHCVNTEGSFNCLCEAGFRPSPESGQCVGKGCKGVARPLPHVCPPALVLGSLEQGTAASSGREAERFPWISLPAENAFIKPLLAQAPSEADSMKTVIIFVLAEHTI